MLQRSGEEILADISSTLDQLIQNAEATREISPHTLERNEVEALQKTQASLIARILHMENSLNGEEKRELLKQKPEAKEAIQQKIAQFSRLNQRLVKEMASRFTKKSKTAKKPLRLRKSRLKSRLKACK